MSCKRLIDVHGRMDYKHALPLLSQEAAYLSMGSVRWFAKDHSREASVELEALHRMSVSSSQPSAFENQDVVVSSV